MHLAKLTVKGFRKIEEAEMLFRPGLNIVIGENNAGKTAVIDALRALLSTTEEGTLRLDESDLHVAADGKRPSWSMNVTIKELGTSPLVQVSLVAATGHDIRVSTVHRVKGESIPAVLYVTNPKSLNSLLTGTADEEGRIGYVAVTRASDLLILAIPKSTKVEKTKELKTKGFTEWPS
ncbi:ATP-dependent nuclease [Burkholderia sp. BCC0322]|uniref:ATP-dependent nuclease n=1 Tax=unclassified Burkholderia TaxID=2613784 RepID=UPI00158C04D9|nr:AAA family ATPase [Burkholderia sp. BCC0322]